MKIPTVCFKALAPPPPRKTNEWSLNSLLWINFESADVLIIPTPIFWGERASFIWRGSKKVFFVYFPIIVFISHDKWAKRGFQPTPKDRSCGSFRKTSVRSWNGSPAVCRKRSYKTFWRMLICILGLPRKSSHLSPTGSHWDDCPVRDGPVPCQSSSVWLYSPTFDPWNT